MDSGSSDALRRRVWEKAAELTGLDVKDLDPQSSLESLGLSSSDAVILAMEVEEAVGREVDVGVFLRFETISEAVEAIVRTSDAEGDHSSDT